MADENKGTTTTEVSKDEKKDAKRTDVKDKKEGGGMCGMCCRGKSDGKKDDKKKDDKKDGKKDGKDGEENK
eukprot:g880.t1